MSAGLEPPRRIWVHGFLTVQGERMSKSLGNMLDPDDMVRAFGPTARATSCCARSRSTATATSRGTRSCAVTTPTWPTTSATCSTGLTDHGQPIPRWRAAGAAADRSTWPMRGHAPGRRTPNVSGHSCCMTRLPRCGVRRRGEPLCRPRTAVDTRQAGTFRRRRGGRATGGVLADLLEACRLIALAAAPFMPMAARGAYAQLGRDFPYAADGQGGPPLAEQAAWGGAPAAGRLGSQAILFPRVETAEA